MVLSSSEPPSERPGFDAEGIPIGHVLRMHGGGGSQYRQASEFWCFRLPPAGRMTIHADWPEHFDEVAIEIDATPHPRRSESLQGPVGENVTVRHNLSEPPDSSTVTRLGVLGRWPSLRPVCFET